MSSPLNRRQLVTGGINVGLISAAGTTPNLVGEAVAGIGAVLGEAYEKAMGKKDAIDKELQEAGKVPDELDKKAREAFAQKPEKTTAESIEDLINSNKLKFDEIEKKRAAMGLSLIHI